MVGGNNPVSLSDNELEQVAGGENGEPEEFDWRTHGYVTPVKDGSEDHGWEYHAVGNVDGQYFQYVNGRRK